ncbi:MAG TPA: SDR family oxidoreductase [Roseiflexaceae bacterium]|nr:SDR family oxidoreductase [Roseiflexaceae bacterium]
MALQGRVAVVTGASSGVGYEVARRRDRLEWLVGEIAGDGGRALAIPTDVTDSQAAARLIDGTVNLCGRIDMLINCAGVVHKIAPLEQFSDEEFRLILETNLYGSFYTARAAIPYMKEQHEGIIINVGSRVGKVGVANIAPFCAAKFALAGLSQALSQELRPHQIYVTTLTLGMVNTDIHPLNPSEELRRQLMSAHDVAQAVAWLCALPASLRIDDLTIMPRLVDL